MFSVTSPELTPRRLRGAALPGSTRELAWSYGLGLVVAVIFYATLLFGGSLHGYDWGSHHYNYFDWVRISLTDFHTLPLFMNDAWVTKNFLANAENTRSPRGPCERSRRDTTRPWVLRFRRRWGPRSVRRDGPWFFAATVDSR